MGFTEQDPRPFTKEDVESLDANQNGVYGLHHTKDWVYVGKSEDIRGRLLDHLNGDNPCITNDSPTHWVAESVNGDPSDREKELILELDPICNKKVG